VAGFTVIAGQPALMLMVKLRLPGQLLLSVAVMVKVLLCAVLGVPLMTPVELLRLKPAGRAPLETEKL
jgi:hypothetical protein